MKLSADRDGCTFSAQNSRTLEFWCGFPTSAEAPSGQRSSDPPGTDNLTCASRRTPLPYPNSGDFGCICPRSMGGRSRAAKAGSNAVEPHAYLADVLTRLVNGHPNSRIDDLLPWAYVA
jgi:hypothetical protein